MMSARDTLTIHITDSLAANSMDLLAYFERRAQADDAADLLAETMTTVWKRATSLPADLIDARLWMFGIARNVLANAERSERRRYRLANKLRLMLLPPHAPPADEDLEVRDAVDRLDADQAELVRLVHWDGFTVTEAAQVLSLPPTTARSRYRKAMTNLRETLEHRPTSNGLVRVS